MGQERTHAEPFIQAEIAKLAAERTVLRDCLMELADASDDYLRDPSAEVFHVLHARLKAARALIGKAS